MACPDLPIAKQACQAVGHVLSGTVQGVVATGFDAVVQAFSKGLETIMTQLLSFWTTVPPPAVAGADGSTPSGPLADLLGFTRPLMAGAAVLGLLVAGARLALSARGGESARAIVRGLLLMVAVAGAGVVVVQVMLDAADMFSTAVLARAGLSGEQFASSLKPLTDLPGGTELGGGLVFLLALFGIMASLVQLLILIARGAIIVVLVGVLPVAAASSSTEMGFSWFKKLWGWIFAFILYKPAAALVYASAFALIDKGRGLLGVISGYMLIILSVFALPALMRLIPPVVLGAGSGGGAAAAGALATGALALSGRGGGGGGNAPAPTHPPGLQPSGAASSAPALPAGGGGNPYAGPAGGSGDGKAGGGAGGSGDGTAGSGAQAGGPQAGGPQAGGQQAGGPQAGGSGAGGGSPAAAGSAAGAGSGAGGAAAAAGPAAAAVSAGLQGYSAVKQTAKQTADGAVGDGSAS